MISGRHSHLRKTRVTSDRYRLLKGDTAHFRKTQERHRSPQGKTGHLKETQVTTGREKSPQGGMHRTPQGDMTHCGKIQIIVNDRQKLPGRRSRRRNVRSDTPQ